MAVRIKLEVDNKAEFDRTFIRFDERISDLKPVFDTDVKPEFFKIQKEQFASEGGAGRSGKWKPLNKRYAAEKQKRFPGAKILERTGRGKRSLTSQTGDTVYRSNAKEMAIGTSLPYMSGHHKGSGKLPTREVISFSDSQKRRMMKTIQKGLVREMRRGGVPVNA